ncbi:MAG: methyltransferase domain-containing protein [Actinoallomurus sp.]
MTANAAQVETWNGDNGRHFITEGARLERMLEPHTDRLLAAAAIRPSERVLDIGCGCGDTTVRAARAADGGHALGVDVSGVMLAEARRLAERELLGNVDFEQADAQTQPFPAAGFDVALSRFGVMFFDDPRAAFTNIATALRPGGRLVFVCWQEPRKVDYFTLPVKAAATHVGPPRRPGPGEPGPFSLADPERIRTLLSEAGFGAVDVADLTVRSWFGQDVEDVVGYYRGMPMARSLVANADEQTTELVFQTLRDALRPRQSEVGVQLAAAAWLVTAVR